MSKRYSTRIEARAPYSVFWFPSVVCSLIKIFLRVNCPEMSVPLRKCGNYDLELSVIGIGGWSFGGGEYWGEQTQKDTGNGSLENQPDVFQ